MVHDQLVICDYIMISILQTGHAAPLSITGAGGKSDCFL